MVPASFGCGSAVFAAIAILAPSRAARSPIASPMPREAPVMNRVLPASDIARAHFLRARNAANAARASSDFRRSLKCIVFGIDLLGDIVKVAAHQLPRHRNGAGRQRRDFPRRLERSVIDRGGIDHVVDDAGVLGLRRRTADGP